MVARLQARFKIILVHVEERVLGDYNAWYFVRKQPLGCFFYCLEKMSWKIFSNLFKNYFLKQNKKPLQLDNGFNFINFSTRQE
jgi:hypothetical protein